MGEVPIFSINLHVIIRNKACSEEELKCEVLHGRSCGRWIEYKNRNWRESTEGLQG